VTLVVWRRLDLISFSGSRLQTDKGALAPFSDQLCDCSLSFLLHLVVHWSGPLFWFRKYLCME